MRKLILTGMAVAMLAVPAAASADAPTGDPVLNESQVATWDDAGPQKAAAEANGENLIGWGSSALIQNGQFISGKANADTDADWQHQKGSRSDQVQAELAKTGRGSQK